MQLAIIWCILHPLHYFGPSFMLLLLKFPPLPWCIRTRHQHVLLLVRATLLAMENNSHFAPANIPQKKAPKCANKKSKLDIWTWMPTSSTIHPPSLILSHSLYSSLLSLQLSSETWRSAPYSYNHLLPPSQFDLLFIFYTYSSLLILPRLTLHALWPMDSIRCALTLLCLLHFIPVINCQSSLFKAT